MSRLGYALTFPDEQAIAECSVCECVWIWNEVHVLEIAFLKDTKRSLSLEPYGFEPFARIVRFEANRFHPVLERLPFSLEREHRIFAQQHTARGDQALAGEVGTGFRGRASAAL